MSTVPPSRALDVLHLSARDVWVTAQAADGYGSLLAGAGEPGSKARAATMKMRAAACWCLVRPAAAPAAFSEARRLYQGLGSPFAIAVAICAGEQELPSVESRQSTAPEDYAYRALWLAWMVASRKISPPTIPARERDWLPVGHLGIPLRLYLNFSRDVGRAIRSGHSRPLASSLPQLLERGIEPLEMAMADRYHWKALATGVMPVEPELLAIGRIVHRALDPWNEDTLTSLGIPRNSVERMPLWVARTLEEPPGGGPSSGPGRRPFPPTPTGGEVAEKQRSLPDVSLRYPSISSVRSRMSYTTHSAASAILRVQALGF